MVFNKCPKQNQLPANKTTQPIAKSSKTETKVIAWLILDDTQMKSALYNKSIDAIVETRMLKEFKPYVFPYYFANRLLLDAECRRAFYSDVTVKLTKNVHS